MRPMTKNMWRELRANYGRFIAIVLIIFLGCAIFVGVKAAGPGLNRSMAVTVNSARLSDVMVFSTTGFDQKDVALAEKSPGAEATLVKFKQVVGQNRQVVALYGYRPNMPQNRLRLESGRVPKRAGEILLDERAKRRYGYRLNQTYTFASSAKLAQRSFKIVGFAESPQYVDESQRGLANVGDGTVRYFAYVPEKALMMPVATQLLVRFKSLSNLDPFDYRYTDAIDKRVEALQKRFSKRADERTKALRKEPLEEIEKSAQALSALPAEPRIAAEKELAAKKQALLLETTTRYRFQTRSDLPGFTGYGESSNRIAAIANVFPVFFFVIAALITFTTITRMVEEARGQIGTFKALGYGRLRIAGNFLNYALLAGLLGSILGGLGGNQALPRLIAYLYRGKYLTMTVVIPITWGVFSIAVFFALLATVGAAAIVVWRELREKPADLMRPRAPKSAKRILLERIKPLWRRLSFNRKVSYRNLFRYKSRLLMTIIGVAGGTALLMTGFGLRDSIKAAAPMQYGKIFHYSVLVSLEDNGEKKAQRVLSDAPGYRRATPVTRDSGKLTFKGKSAHDINLLTPRSTRDFTNDVTLRQDGRELKLPANGIVLAKKVADILDVKAGDTVSFVRADGKTVKMRVAAIVEHYIGLFAYTSPASYQKAFGVEPKVNTLLATFGKQSDKQRSALADSLLKSGSVKGTSFTVDAVATIDQMSKTMAPIVIIFVLLSGMLSFVVMYNLTNINISERIRELSTIKVLGFFNREVTMYIVRENVILTLAGITLGYLVGWWLLLFILQQAATELIIFPVVVGWLGWVLSAGLMIAFALIVVFVTHWRLRRIDMIGALKSLE